MEVAGAGDSPLKIVQPRSGKNEMRVTIDETRHDDFAGGIEDVGVTRLLDVLHAAAGAEGVDFLTDDQDGAVLDDSQLRKLAAAAGRQAAQGEQLAGSSAQQRFRPRYRS